MPVSPWSTDQVLTFAGLADAAYLEAADAKALLTALGATFIEQFGSDDCQVTLAEWDGWACMLHQGTRVTSSPSIPELWCDIDGVPVAVDGGLAHMGFWVPLAALAPTIKAKLPASLPLLIGGHSLGGSRAHLSGLIWPEATIWSFGAPKAANHALWAKVYADRAPPLRVVAEADFAPAWPWDSDFGQPPAPMIWLHGQTIQALPHRPSNVFPYSIADHDLTASYQALLKADQAAGVPIL